MTRAVRVLIVIAVGALLVAGSKRSEYEIKAAFLYKFATLVQWPEGTFRDATEPFVIAVVGDDPFGKDLEDVLGGKSVAGRPLALQRYAEPALLRPCHVLFISESETDHVDALLERLAGLPVLTVADDVALVERGVMVSFHTAGRKIRFDVNVEAAERAGLAVGADLRELAVSP